MTRASTFLMYHELRVPGRALCSDDPGYVRYVVDGAAFGDQMRLLVANHLAVVGVSAWVDGIADEQESVVLTFDDGCETDLLVAAPIIRELGLHATCYLTVDFLGRPGYLTRAQARALASKGIEIGCHSMSHVYLSDVGDERLEQEVVTAKDTLEQICGCRVRSFSCPGGRFDRRLLPLTLAAGYDSLVTSRPSRNRPGAKPTTLGRVAIMGTATPHDVLALALGRGLRALRMRGAALAFAKAAFGNSLYERIRGRALD